MSTSLLFQLIMSALIAFLALLGIQVISRRIVIRPSFMLLTSLLAFLAVSIASAITGVSQDEAVCKWISGPIIETFGIEPLCPQSNPSTDLPPSTVENLTSPLWTLNTVEGEDYIQSETLVTHGYVAAVFCDNGVPRVSIVFRSGLEGASERRTYRFLENLRMGENLYVGFRFLSGRSVTLWMEKESQQTDTLFLQSKRGQDIEKLVQYLSTDDVQFRLSVNSLDMSKTMFTTGVKELLRSSSYLKRCYPI